MSNSDARFLKLEKILHTLPIKFPRRKKKYFKTLEKYIICLRDPKETIRPSRPNTLKRIITIFQLPLFQNSSF